jgi:hypothetical protein
MVNLWIEPLLFSMCDTRMYGLTNKNTVAAQPIFQPGRHQALGNVILLNVHFTGTTSDPIKRRTFPIQNKFFKNRRNY